MQMRGGGVDISEQRVNSGYVACCPDVAQSQAMLCEPRIPLLCADQVLGVLRMDVLQRPCGADVLLEWKAVAADFNIEQQQQALQCDFMAAVLVVEGAVEIVGAGVQCRPDA